MADFSSGIKLQEGDIIKGYEVKKVFDPGAFAFASKAVSPTGRVVFFKKYKRPGGSSPWLQGYIDYQAELKRRIQGDAVAKKLCYDFVEFFERCKPGGSSTMRAFYQVFEWVEGGSDLRKVIDQLKTGISAYDWDQRVVFARVMTAGIHAIHKAGVVHTDLKPENFYLVPDPSIPVKWKIRVIDMDFSLLEGKQAPWHGHEGYVGTPGYMSPEHLNNLIPGRASDVFTLALIIGELLGSGHPVAGQMDHYDEFVRSGNLPTVEIQQPVERVPDMAFLNYVVNACLRLEPANRPTAEQLLKALNGALDQFDGIRPGSTIASSPPSKPTKSALPAEKLKSVPPPLPTKPPSLTAPKAKPVTKTPATPPPLPNATRTGSTVEIVGPGGAVLKAAIPTKLGRNHLKRWGEDFEKFMSPEQFQLFKDDSGGWIVEHCSYAKNVTNVDGIPLTQATPVRDGMTLTLGKTGKCQITLKIT
jgi:serine/threonine protein kinase